MTRECFMQFEVSATDGKARRGEMTFPRGKVQTPAFFSGNIFWEAPSF